MSLQAKYTEEQKAVALAYYAATGDNQRKTSRDCQIPLGTLQNWIRGGAVNGTVTQKSVIKKGVMADECERLAWKLLGGMDDQQKIDEAALNTLSVSFGTLVDKMRLLRGESTQSVDVSDARDTLRAKLASILPTPNE